jgi:gamma-glutamylcyclotransferase (GGCT)/AIG2-like uncharacterized protein YtfP
LKVFVYGTLKIGYGNNRLLSDANFIGEARTDDKFNMIGGGFPVIFKSEDGLPVKGEVWEFPDERSDILANLDRLEAEGTMYFREAIPVALENHDRCECSAYIGNPQFWARSMDVPMNKQFTTPDGVLEWNR